MGSLIEITDASAYRSNMARGFNLDRVFITVTGFVPSSGWSAFNLSERFVKEEPADGLWEFDIVADQPLGLVIPCRAPFSIGAFYSPPDWMKKIVIYGKNKKVIDVMNKNSKIYSSKIIKSEKAQPPVLVQLLASYDDSQQPIGFCGGFSVRMKKLVHTLTLYIYGPSESDARNCVNNAAGIGLIAAIIAAFATGGGAFSAAISSFIASLENCLGDKFTIKIDDSSHWEEWCT